MTRTSAAETRELIVTALDGAQRDPASFVRDHCGDPALADTITALLDLHAAGPVNVAPVPIQVDVPALAPGDAVGPYLVDRPLGRGGMGAVFLATDPRLDRRVALKCLVPSRAAGGDLSRRVIQEARAAARISHPNVAAVYDVLEQDGRAFIVMEYVQGESLSEQIDRGALSAERVVDISRQLAAGLAAAHSAGIIHRDLKPANVQVKGDGSIKILDFGIAMAIASATATTATTIATLSDAPPIRAGTPAFMSPEQLLGRAVDERSDLFSLAVMMFHMATGRRPVASDDPLELLVAAVRTLPRADAVAPTVPAGLADIIAKGLAANPKDRYQSAAALAAALDAVRDELFTALETRPTASLGAKRFVVIGASLVALPLIFLALGRLTSAAYNVTLERTGPFADDPAALYIELGWRSLVAPAVYAAMATAVVWLARFLLMLVGLSAAGQRQLTAIRRGFGALSSRLGLDNPAIVAQALVTLGVIAIALVGWRFNSLIRAWGTTVSTADPSQLAPLGPDNESQKVLYRAVLTILFVAFAGGLWRVIHLRLRSGVRGGTGALAALIAIVAALLVLNEFPYRLMWKSKVPRVTYAGQRCSIIGEAGTRRLLYCPGSPPPKNKDVDVSDPAMGPPGVVENIFAPVAPHR